MDPQDRRIAATYLVDQLDAVLAEFDTRPEVAALIAQCRIEGHVPAEWRNRWYCDRCGEQLAITQTAPSRD